MNNLTYLQIQAIELRKLLDSAAADPILEPQLRERLADAEEALRACQHQPGMVLPKENVLLPRAAIFLRGAGVLGSEGIRPLLAGEALIQYEKMYTAQALHDEREAARGAGRQRRPRGTPDPQLLFTGTPRGSFGLEFVPQVAEDSSLLGVHARSLRNVAEALVSVAEAVDTSLDQAIKRIPPRVIQPLTQFLKTLAQHGAELRLAFHDGPSRSLTGEQIGIAAERLVRDVEQDTVPISGVFRGLTHESGMFDLKTDDGSVITGSVADNLVEEDLDRFDLLFNRRCVAELQKTTVRRLTGPSTPTYVLLDAHEEVQHPPEDVASPRSIIRD